MASSRCRALLRPAAGLKITQIDDEPVGVFEADTGLPFLGLRASSLNEQ